MKILVLGGGTSPEKFVSQRSAAAVSKALREAGYEVVEADPADGLEILDSIDKTDIVFPILHGAEGEDGAIQKILEDKGLPYLGSDSEVSGKCFDKGISRDLLLESGIAMAEGASGITSETYHSHPLASRPHVLKAQRGGSSIGTYLVKDPSAIDQTKVDEVFELDSEAVIEELVEGVEITVPVIDGKALSVIEIKPPENGEFDYENKYNGESQEICPAVSMSTDKQKEAQALAIKVHEVLGCRHISRADMIVRPDGTIIVLETNTMPGLTDQSLVPVAAKEAGMSMPEFTDKLVKLVMRDYNLTK